MLLREKFNIYLKSLNDEDGVNNAVLNELATIINALYLDISYPTIFQDQFLFPLNAILYEMVLETAVIDMIDTDSVDDVNEINEILKAVEPMKKMLSINSNMEKISILSTISDMYTSATSLKTINKLDIQTRKYLKIVLKLKYENLEPECKKYYMSTVAILIHKLGTRLCDYLDSYQGDNDVMTSNARVYSNALDVYLKTRAGTGLIYVKPDEIEDMISLSARFFVRCSVSANMERIKDQFKGQTETDIQFMNDYVNMIKEELDSGAADADKIASMYIKDSEHEASVYTMKLLCKDLCLCLSNQTVSTCSIDDLVPIFKTIRELCSTHFSDCEDLHMDEWLEGASASVTPILDKWINKVQGTMADLLQRMIAMEKWVPISQKVTYSSSIVDLFSILEQSSYVLPSICVPKIPLYVRAYIQCVAGIIQQYGNLVAQGLPAPVSCFFGANKNFFFLTCVIGRINASSGFH